MIEDEYTSDWMNDAYYLKSVSMSNGEVRQHINRYRKIQTIYSYEENGKRHR